MTRLLVFLSFLVCFVSQSFTQSFPNNQAIRINSGGPEGTYGGEYFQRGDTSIYSHNGYCYVMNSGVVANTNTPEIYRSESYHDQLHYSIDVIDDNCYELHLHFAEIWFNAPGGYPGGIGSRVFDVVANGDTLLDNYDIMLMQGGAMLAGIESFRLCLDPGEDTIELEFLVGAFCGSSAKVSAIEIVPDGTGPVTPVIPSFPVEWLAFDASYEAGRAWLRWATATELNNDFFTVERSWDGRTYEPLATIPGAGFSNEVNHYEVEDFNPLQGTTYYRIRQTDFDGSESFSEVEILSFSNGQASVEVYPNPAPTGRVAQMNLMGFEAENEIQVSMRNSHGRSVWSRHIHTDMYGNAHVTLPNDRRMSAGVYVLTAVGATAQVTRRLVLE